MHDLADGESVPIQGSARLPYILKNVGGVYSCSCPAWRNQSLPIERRTCKHLRSYRGEAAEEFPRYFFLGLLVDCEIRPGLSVVIVPLPNLRVSLLDPSDRVVIVPEPNGRVIPVTVFPSLPRSRVIVPLPNFVVWLDEPSDREVVVPLPNGRVVLVTVLPFLPFSVVMVPWPNLLVVLLDPSDRVVIEPFPNGRVVPVTGLRSPAGTAARGQNASPARKNRLRKSP